MIIRRDVNLRPKLDERVFFTAKQRLLNYIDFRSEFLSLLAIAWDGFSKDKLTMVAMADW